jgi:hypothetical protein
MVLNVAVLHADDKYILLCFSACQFFIKTKANFNHLHAEQQHLDPFQD